MITIRKARPADLPGLMLLFEQGRRIMRESGNQKQWTNGYPTAEIVMQDIRNGNCHICLDEKGEAVGTFVLIQGEEPTYHRIYEGAWADDTRPYATIHRLAAAGPGRGVAAACLKWCGEQSPNLRADTHRDNRIMQHILQKHGFRYCGIIYLANGDERLAYQKCNP